MQDNKNLSFCANRQTPQGSVCIDTHKVMDCCRDRDCFEDVKVYLTACGESILQNATTVRTRTAKILYAFLGVQEVPFNCGFYQVYVRYFIELEFEACVAGRTQSFKGLTVAEKDVILYGGEGRAVSFFSGVNSDACGGGEIIGPSTNDPVAIVETVDPIVLGTKVLDCTCHPPRPCSGGDFVDIPESVKQLFGDELVMNSPGHRILVSFGIFSVIRIVRPAQILVDGTDYCVPDKECSQATSTSDPCTLFNSISFPVSQFRGGEGTARSRQVDRGGGCGCK